jgi:DNA-binding NarL/FixJ family response regulator
LTQEKTVLIVDAQPIYRIGIQSTIEHETGYQVIGEAGDEEAALRICKEFKPDLALIAMSLPNENGIELTRRTKKISQQTRIMMISLNFRIEDVIGAFKAGAMGYIVKECASDILMLGLGAVLRGEYFFNGSVSREAVKDLAAYSKKEEQRSDTGYGSLTPREQEVLGLLVEGIPRKMIAKRLFLSPKTIENHTANIMKKLSVNSQLELVRYAAKVGLINVDEWKRTDGRRRT